MEFIPFEDPIILEKREELNNTDLYHYIFRQRRKALGLTQAQVAEKVGIQLRQYIRIESGEVSYRKCTAENFLSICAVLKLFPYTLFPELDDSYEKKKISPSGLRKPVAIIPAKHSRFVPASEYMDLMRKVPKGALVTVNTIEEYLRIKYNVECVQIGVEGTYIEKINETYPYWRKLTAKGQLFATTRFHSRDIQQRLLEDEGFEIVPCGANMNSLKVKDYTKYLFDLNSLLDS